MPAKRRVFTHRKTKRVQKKANNPVVVNGIDDADNIDAAASPSVPDFNTSTDTSLNLVPKDDESSSVVLQKSDVSPVKVPADKDHIDGSPTKLSVDDRKIDTVVLRLERCSPAKSDVRSPCADLAGAESESLQVEHGDPLGGVGIRKELFVESDESTVRVAEDSCAQEPADEQLSNVVSKKRKTKSKKNVLNIQPSGLPTGELTEGLLPNVGVCKRRRIKSKKYAYDYDSSQFFESKVASVVSGQISQDNLATDLSDKQLPSVPVAKKRKRNLKKTVQVDEATPLCGEPVSYTEPLKLISDSALVESTCNSKHLAVRKKRKTKKTIQEGGTPLRVVESPDDVGPSERKVLKTAGTKKHKVKSKKKLCIGDVEQLSQSHAASGKSLEDAAEEPLQTESSRKRRRKSTSKKNSANEKEEVMWAVSQCDTKKNVIRVRCRRQVVQEEVSRTPDVELNCSETVGTVPPGYAEFAPNDSMKDILQDSEIISEKLHVDGDDGECNEHLLSCNLVIDKPEQVTIALTTFDSDAKKCDEEVDDQPCDSTVTESIEQSLTDEAETTLNITQHSAKNTSSRQRRRQSGKQPLIARKIEPRVTRSRKLVTRDNMPKDTSSSNITDQKETVVSNVVENEAADNGDEGCNLDGKSLENAADCVSCSSEVVSDNIPAPVSLSADIEVSRTVNDTHLENEYNNLNSEPIIESGLETKTIDMPLNVQSEPATPSLQSSVDQSSVLNLDDHSTMSDSNSSDIDASDRLQPAAVAAVTNLHSLETDDLHSKTPDNDVDTSEGEVPLKKRRVRAVDLPDAAVDPGNKVKVPDSCSSVTPRGNKFVGAHTSVTGNPASAVFTARHFGSRAFSMFIKCQSKFQAPPLDDIQINEFKAALKKCGYLPHFVLPHGSYLINCGSDDLSILSQSRHSLVDDLQRCLALGLPHFNIHPGSFKGDGCTEECINRIADSINYTHECVETVVTVLENMCGQPKTIGGHFSELRQIIDRVSDKSRIGVCLDTCHAFAAGYDIRSQDGYRQMMDEFDNVIGFKYLKAIHVNDSRDELGSHRDHHTSIGKGQIGLDCFRWIMNDNRFDGLPIILETPFGSHKSEIDLLYSLVD